jgi:hypothetical protein
MQSLLTAIVTWLSLNYGLPASFEHPRVEIVPPMQIAALRYGGVPKDRALQVAGTRNPEARAGQDVVAVYDDARHTIYLPEGWSGRNAAETSVLVHEMVHHLQNLAGLKHECPQAREKLAYEAQDQWLKRFGQDLETAFEIDKMTLLVRTRCFH